MRKPLRYLIVIAVLFLFVGGLIYFGEFETVNQHYLNHPEEIPKDADTVTLQIDCLLLEGNENLLSPSVASALPEGYLYLPETKFLYTDGMTPFDLLLLAERAYRIRLDYTGGLTGSYVTTIGDLSEFSAGAESGWTVLVNGSFLSTGSSSFRLSPGDTVRWTYTVSIGDLFY